MGQTTHGGLAGQLLGATTEFRFFEAFQAPDYGSPYWFKSIRKASPEEDKKGVDAFAIIDVGTVLVQIKSSLAGLKNDRRNYKDAHCVIIIPETMDAKRLRSHTFNRLYVWRGLIINSAEKRRKKGTR